jgi:phage tail sheath gpL-like
MSGTIGFQHYPAGNRVPGVYEEIDPTKANSGTQAQNTLIIGQQLSSGLLVPSQPVICMGATDTSNKAGTGSMLAKKVARYRKTDNFGTIYLLPLADDPAGVAATGSILFTGAATAAGTLPVYIGEEIVNVGVTAGMAVGALATALVAAITANPYLPVTATASTATVTLTAKNKGLAGNEIQINIAYGGAPAGQSVPAGVAYTITAMSGGTTNPSLTAGLLNLGDQPFDFIDVPYNDTVSLGAMQTFLDANTGRWSWNRMIWGQAFGAMRGTLGTATTLLTARNDSNMCIMPMNNSITPSWLLATDITAAAAVSIRADPAVPIQYVPIPAVAPPIASRFVFSDRQTLLSTGGSTFLVGADGTVSIERLVTTYQTNAAGAPDNSWLDVETGASLTYVNRDLRNYLLNTFPRKVFVSDSTPAPTNSNRVNSKTIKAAIIGRYYYLQDVIGIVQNADQFAAQVQVVNAGNGLAQVLAPVQLANQLRQIAILVQFSKP